MRTLAENREPTKRAFEIVKMPSVPFRVCDVSFRISLSPVYILSIRKGIQEELKEQLMRYNEDLDGILVAYKNVQLIHNHARIINESPLLHCTVKLKALVLCPKIGSSMEGVVNKVGSNHVGLLVANVFNASIPATDLDGVN